MPIYIAARIEFVRKFAFYRAFYCVKRRAAGAVLLNLPHLFKPL